MTLPRRDFLKLSAGAAALAVPGCSQTQDRTSASSDPISRLKPMMDDVVPITDEERLGRIEKARRLMKESGMNAIYLEGSWT